MRMKFWFGEEIRYVKETKCWHIWNGQRWVEDLAGTEVTRMATKISKHIFDEAAEINDGEAARQLAAWGIASCSHKHLTAMVSLAKAQEGIAVSINDFDLQPDLLNCRNGVVDLATGKRMPHCSDLMMTKMVPVDFVPEAECPIRLKFLHRVEFYPATSSPISGFE